MGLFVLFLLGRDGGLPAKPENIREAPSGRRSEQAAEEEVRGKKTIRRLFLRVHGGADVVSAGLLLDGRGDDGGVRDAGLVEAVRWRGHHVRGEAAGDQAGGGVEWRRRRFKSGFVRAGRH